MSKTSRRATAVPVQYDADMRGHVLNGAHRFLDGFVPKIIAHSTDPRDMKRIHKSR